MDEREKHIRECLERFRSIIADRLDGIEASKRRGAEAAVSEMARRQFDLMMALENGELSEEAFRKRLAVVLADGYRDVEHVLGRDQFIAAFDAPAEAVAEFFSAG